MSKCSHWKDHINVNHQTCNTYLVWWVSTIIFRSSFNYTTEPIGIEKSVLFLSLFFIHERHRVSITFRRYLSLISSDFHTFCVSNLCYGGEEGKIKMSRLKRIRKKEIRRFYCPFILFAQFQFQVFITSVYVVMTNCTKI